MKAFYDEKFVDILQEKESVISSFGNDIFLRPIPDDEREGVLDPREFELAKKTLKERVAMVNTIENLRRQTGFPNINLNTVEIITDCFEVKGELPFRVWVYYPRKPFDVEKRAAVLYAHGGSWLAGSPFGEENMLKYLSEKADAVIFNIEYALAPEHPFPCALNQVKEAMKALKEKASLYHVDMDNIYLSGDSSGANLALVASQEKELLPIKGLLLYYPVVAVDFPTLPFEWKEEHYVMREEYRPFILPRLILGRSDKGADLTLPGLIFATYLRHNENPKDVLISPLYYPLKEYPPILMFTAEYDGLREQDDYFASKVNECGGYCKTIRYKGIHHGFVDKFGYFPQAEDSVLEMAKFINERR